MSAAAEVRPRRSFLFVPGTGTAMFDKAIAAGPDIVCVDLEDAVAPPHKHQARHDTLAMFASRTSEPACETLIRINGLRSREGLEDLLAVLDCPHPPRGLMLPKVKHPEEIVQLDDLLTTAGSALRLQVIIETNEGLEAAHDIARASPRARRCGFSSAPVPSRRIACTAGDPMSSRAASPSWSVKSSAKPIRSAASRSRSSRQRWASLVATAANPLRS